MSTAAVPSIPAINPDDLVAQIVADSLKVLLTNAPAIQKALNTVATSTAVDAHPDPALVDQVHAKLLADIAAGRTPAP